MPAGVLVLLLSGALAGGTQPYETYEEAVAADGPTAQFRFNDLSGSSTIADSVGSYTATNDGVGLGGEGPFGGSRSGSFEASAYAALPSSPLLNDAAFTAEGWVEWTGGTSYEQPIFDFGSSTTNYMFLTPAGGSKHLLLFEIRTSASKDVQVTAPKLTAKKWEYVAVTETSAGTLTLYVNGERVGQTAGATLFPSSLGSVTNDYLGKSQLSSAPSFNGSLSNVAFYGKALSEERVKVHYDDGEYPVNTVLPTITGTARDGSSLSAGKGTWSGLAPITYGYQWMLCNSAGAGCASIPAASSTKYVLGHEDVGATLRVAVTGTNSAGGSTATSAQTAVIAPLAPSNTALPSISGAAEQGQLLSVGNGSWEGTPPFSYTYKWETCNGSGEKCKAISGAAASSYRVLGSQIGDTLRAIITAQNAAGSKSATSEATAAITTGPPASVVLPAISGRAEDGQTLSASSGEWAGTEPISYAYQWQLCNGAGEACADISGATGSSYGLGPSDVGDTLRVAVTAKNSVGSTTATSHASTVVAAIPPSNTAPPPISGTATDGQTLAASTGSWNGSPPLSYGYQWERCNSTGESCTNVSGATGSTYVLGHFDVGDTLRVAVTATNPRGSASSTSAASPIVAALAPSNTVTPTISGEAQDGQTLTASPGEWAGTPPLTYEYQWQRCDGSGESCANIAGATDSSYVLAHGDVASTLRVLVTATNTAGSASAISAASGVVEALAPSSTSPPTISGEAEQGQTLSAGTGEWEGTPPILYSYQWQSCNSLGEGCLAISGATSASYTLGAGEVGMTVRVIVTATNSAGSAAAASQATAPVAGSGGSGGPLVFSMQFGSEGSGPGQFIHPGDVAVDGSGDVWVLDVGNDRVEEFSAAGEYLRQFGSPGSGEGQLSRPDGLALDASGDVWVLDTGNGRVEEFSSTGEFIRTAGSGVIGSAEGIAIDRHDDVWVSNTYGGQLDVFNDEGQELKAVGSRGSGAGQLDEPEGLAVDSSGHVWVAEWATNRVQEFSESGEYLGQFGTAGSAPGEISHPYGVATGAGHVFVAEVGNDRLQVFEEDGTFVEQLGTAGSEPGEISINFPVGLALNAAGDLWVTDYNNDRVEKWAPATPEAPTNTTPPSISGTPAVGRMLSASPGEWRGSPPPTYDYSWRICNAAGEECEEISGATSSSYTPVAADAGRTLRVSVTASNGLGSASSSSEATGTISFPPVNTAPPTISGTAQDGETLSVSTGAWEGGSAISYSYQWQRCRGGGGVDASFAPAPGFADPLAAGGGGRCTNIAGATGATYTLQDEDVGDTVKAIVIATDADGETEAESTPSERVQAQTSPEDSEPPTISGVATDGQTLTGSTGVWRDPSVISYTYQWERCNAAGGECEDIPGASESDYTAGDEDVAHTLRLSVTATNEAGSGSADSVASERVQAAAPVEQVAPSVAGSATEGQTLTASPGSWSGAPAPSYDFQWQRCNGDGEDCVDIAAANGTSYQLAQADVGSTVRVHVTATNVARSASASSAVSAVVASNGALAPSSTSAPTISGSLEAGQTVRASAGEWGGSEPFGFTYEWQSCDVSGTECIAIEGATAQSYTISSTEEGSTLRVLVTATGPGGQTQAASALSAAVGAGAPSELGPPAITGSPTVGQALDGDAGEWGGGEEQTAYQWEACNQAGTECQTIPGADQGEFTPEGGYVGDTLRLRVGVSNAQGSVTALSAASSPVQAASMLSNTAAPLIEGEAAIGGTLTATPGGWLGNEAISYTYQWQRCDLYGADCEAISGADEASYAPSEADAGHTLRVLVGASEAEGTGSEISLPTLPVAASGGPVATAPPVITGSGLVGYTLNAGAGEWEGEAGPLTYTYQWQRCNEEGEACNAIEGASQPTYTLSDADAGAAIRVLVTATGNDGSSEAASAPIIASALAVANASQPQISGSGELGRPLTAAEGIWTGAGPLAFAYEWQRCGAGGCQAIAGADEASYSPQQEDAGDQLQVAVVAHGPASSASKTSPPTAAIGSEPTRPENTLAPSVEGPLTVGLTLSASTGSWSGSAPISYTYQWQRCNLEGASCTAIEGATSQTLTLDEEDLGTTIRVLVQAENSAGSESAISQASEAIGAAGPPTNAHAPAINGQAREGQQLYAENGEWTGTQPLTFYYHWQRCNSEGEACTPIEGATKALYTPVAADVGATLRVRVTASNTLASVGALSAPSTTVASSARASASLALEALEAHSPSLIAPSSTAQIEEEPVTPALQDTGQQLTARSTLASSTTSKSSPGEFALETADGELSLTPVEPATNAASLPTLANGAAAVFAETWKESDTIVRPGALGDITLLQMRSKQAPTSFSWEVGIGPDQHLQQLPDGAVAIVETTYGALEAPIGEGPLSPGPSEAPADQEGQGYGAHGGEEELDRSLAEEQGLPPLPAAPTVSTSPTSPRAGELHPQDTQAGYERDTSAMSYAETQTGEAVLMVIEAPTVLDATGTPIPATLSADGDTITLAVSPPAGASYPLDAEIPAAAPSNPVSSARDPLRYGLSDAKSESFTSLNAGLTQSPLKIKVARDIVPYNVWETSERGGLENWLRAVAADHLEPYLTLEACKTQCPKFSREAYRDDITPLFEALTKPEAGLPTVNLWGAWNEPDNPKNPLVNDAPEAALFWKAAHQILYNLGCHTCTLVAGEFFEYDTYIGKYISTMLQDHQYGGAIRPSVWGFHDYYDLVHHRANMEHGSGNADLRKFVHEVDARVGKRRIFASEQGVLLRDNGGPGGKGRYTELHDGTTVDKKVGKKVDKIVYTPARLQREAADDFLELGKVSSSIELVDYYLYKGPSATQEENGSNEFDSALVPGEKIEGEPVPREAYCVLVENKRTGCPPPTKTVKAGAVSTSSASLVGNVNPEGLITNYTFEYGTTTHYGQTTTATALVSPVGAQTVTAAVSGLQSCTTYHFQVFAENEATNGTPSPGGDKTFATPCGAPSAIALGYGHRCELVGTEIVCAGANGAGELGNGTTESSSTPVLVSGISEALNVTAGDEYSCATLASGTVDCWGASIGGGGPPASTTPVPVEGLGSASLVTAVGLVHACAITGGRVACWGADSSGQAPGIVSGLSGLVDGLGGGIDFTCGLLESGHVQCWGEVGGGVSSTPLNVSGVSEATSLTADGVDFVCASMKSGEVKCWGTGDLSAEPVSGVQGAVAVSGGESFACALLQSGEVDCWSNGGPATVVSGVSNAIAIAASSGEACAVIESGAVDCWSGVGGGGGSPDVLRGAGAQPDAQSQAELEAGRVTFAREREYQSQQLQPGL